MTEEPDNTAVRVALWRALHLLVDGPPPVVEDDIGLRLVDPPEGWRERPDMDPAGTAGFRAAIVARARFLDDLVAEQAATGVDQYVILGAGLDTFAQRHPALASRLDVYEVERVATQAWKRQRLEALGYGVSDRLHLVPVDFEVSGAWWTGLEDAGFDTGRPALVSSSGVSMYLSRDATAATLGELSSLAPGSTVVMTFLLPPDQLGATDRAGLETSATGARASGTPFVSLYRPEEMQDLAYEAGFSDVRHVPGSELGERYFAGRTDGLRPGTGEEFIVARV